MPTTHYKRLRMEIDLRKITLDDPRLPTGYSFATWHPLLVNDHALAKYRSFIDEIDADVFESLSHLSGCQRLMSDIAQHSGFLPLATWLIRSDGNESANPEPVATIQGIRKSQWIGGIQNVGVVTAHRGFGLGRSLLLKSLHGFRQLGFHKVRLDVTAANQPAVKLYSAIGFRIQRTSYLSITQRDSSACTA